MDLRFHTIESEHYVHIYSDGINLFVIVVVMLGTHQAMCGYCQIHSLPTYSFLFHTFPFIIILCHPLPVHAP